MRNFWPPLMLFGFITVGLQFLVSAEWVSASLVPAPTQVLAALTEFQEDLRRAFVETLLASLIGYLIAALGGFFLAVALSFSGRLKRAVLPFAIFFQTVPIIAIAPLLIIYLGFGIQTVVACAAIVAIFPVLANTLIGLESIDEGDLELFRVYSASRRDIFWKLRLPRSYLPLYAGLKVAAGLSVIGAVAGEFVTGSGLGSLIDSARTQQRIDLVFAALLLLSLIGLGLIGLLRLFNLAANARRPLNMTLKD